MAGGHSYYHRRSLGNKGGSRARDDTDVVEQIRFDRTPCRSGFHARDQQGSFRLEALHLGCVAEPSAGVNLRSGRGVRNAAMVNIAETRGVETVLPFFGRKQMRGNLEVE